MKTINEMVREAGFPKWDDHEPVTVDMYERFAELVRDDEREECAKAAEDSDHVVGGRGYYDQLGDADATVRNIVAAIRARGETK